MKIQAPPTIQFLLMDKRVRNSSREQLASMCKDKGFLHELEVISTESLEHYHYIDAEDRPYSAELVLSPSGFDPLSGGFCQHLECRLAAATSFGRFTALYSDFSVLVDVFSIITSSSGLDSVPSIHMFVDNLMVLRQLQPLVTKGLLRFGTPKWNFCTNCGEKLNKKAQEAAGAITELVAKDLRFRLEKNLLVIDLGKVDSEGHLMIFEAPKKLTSESAITERKMRAVGLDVFAKGLETRFFNLLLRSVSASRLKSVILSSSELEMLGLSEMDNSRPNSSALDSWKAHRYVDLPWIRDLSIDEALILREEAATALPRLRERLNTKLLATPQPSEEEIFKLISELREESATVESELQTLGKGRFDPLVGGVGIVVFGVGCAVGAGIAPPVLLAGLLALLGQVYISAHKDDQHELSLTSKPAYALLKAKDILSHRGGSH